MEIFAKRLKQLRLEKELSLDMVVYDLDKRYNVEITKSHLSRWENDKKRAVCTLCGLLSPVLRRKP